jgi:hypothetical protein
LDRWYADKDSISPLFYGCMTSDRHAVDILCKFQVGISQGLVLGKSDGSTALQRRIRGKR